MIKHIKQLFKGFIGSAVYSNTKPLLDNQTEQITLIFQRLLSISALHQRTFSSFKNKYIGKDVVIVGAGPSLKDFKPLKDCIYIGLNSACTYDKVKFDYLFSIDKIGIDKIYPQFAAVDCVKFVGDQNLGPAFQIPETEIAKMGDVRRYKTDSGIRDQHRFSHDIEFEPIGNFNTVSLQAMQFALYTLPRRIYLVGIDCSSAGHFNKVQTTTSDLNKKLKERNSEELSVWSDLTVQNWCKLKEFANIYYPSIEIISVNPVNLRGLFMDLDQ